jgi:MFS family permease
MRAHTSTHARQTTSNWKWVAVVSLGALYVGSTLPTPLYPIYRRDFGFSELIVSAVYASYVVGNLTALIALGRLSDQLGRRPITLAAFAVLIISTLCFLFSKDTAWLFIARVLNGLAAGLGAGALTAWIGELGSQRDKGHAVAAASAGNFAGLGVGALASGFLAQYGPWPLRTPYLVYLMALVVLIVLIRIAPEGVKQVVRDPARLSLRPHIGVPRNIRFAFVAPASMAFVTFSLVGFYAALTPGLLIKTLDQHNLAVVGTLVALFFGVGAATAAATRKLGNRASMSISTIALLAGLALLVTAEHQRSMSLLVVATVVSGAAAMIGYRCSLQIVSEIAPAAHRAEVVSSYLFICYTGNSLPVIGIGLLSLAIDASKVHLGFAIMLGVLSLIACAIGVKPSRPGPR